MDYFLGTDLKLDDSGDLSLQAGDLSLVAGKDCLIANLYDRILTDPGELILHPEFGAGLMAKVSLPLTDEKINSLIIELRHQLLAEPRINQVISLEETLTDRYLFIKAIIETIDHQVISNLIFPFELEIL